MDGRIFWCRRRDLNPHGETPTRPSNVRVCHSTTSALVPTIMKPPAVLVNA